MPPETTLDAAVLRVVAALWIASSCACATPNTCAALIAGALFRTGTGSTTGGGTTRSIHGERVKRCTRPCDDAAARCVSVCGIDDDAAACEDACHVRRDACVEDCMPPEPVD